MRSIGLAVFIAGTLCAAQVPHAESRSSKLTLGTASRVENVDREFACALVSADLTAIASTLADTYIHLLTPPAE
jgi:hypothetical protein